MASMERRKRRHFTPEYKAQVVEVVRTSGKRVGQVAKELDLTETAVRAWVKQAEIDEKGDPHGPMDLASYKGDTGGPCLRETERGLELVGISQRGLGLTPTFTRIAPYRGWLEEQIRLASERHPRPRSPSSAACASGLIPWSILPSASTSMVARMALKRARSSTPISAHRG